MENEIIQRESLTSTENMVDHESNGSEGSSIKPPDFNLTAKLHNTELSPYEDRRVDDVGNRYAFGKSSDTMDDKNIT